MFEVVFYEDRNGHSEIGEFLDDLAARAPTNKDARIQLKQLAFYIELLASQGTRLPPKVTKHLRGEVWELRPGDNRVLYFFFDSKAYVLLHWFRKKTQKTPVAEIEKAEREIADYKSRKER